MSNLRPRDNSPTRNQSHSRASTGALYTSSYDTLSSTQPGRSTVSSVSGHPNDVLYEARPTYKTTYQDGKKTVYAVKPRRNSTTGQDAKRPLTVSTRDVSPQRRSLLVASPREITPAGPPRDDSARLLHPIAPTVNRNGDDRHHHYHHQHHRHNSTSRAELDRYDSGRDGRDRLYHLRASQGYGAPKQYYSNKGQLPRKPDEEEWSYTGPREQFDRDYPIRPRRESHNRRERPLSVYDTERPSSLRREYGPPPSASRQSERVDRGESGRAHHASGFDSDPDRPSELARKRQSNKAPVIHQDGLRDDGYSSAREDYYGRDSGRAQNSRYDDDDDDRRRDRYKDNVRDSAKEYRREREREEDRERYREFDRSDRDKAESRRKPKSRDLSPERSRLKEFAVGALGSLATAGTLGVLSKEGKDKDADSDDADKKEHRRRRRKHRRDADASEDSDGPSSTEKSNSRRIRHAEASSSDTPEDQAHRRQHGRYADGNESDSEHIRSQRHQRVRAPPGPRPKGESPPRDERQAHEILPVSAQDEEPKLLEYRTMSPGENEDDRPRRVTLVEPEKRDDIKPRGILKPARQVPFPEDPNPIREGVAPLKDAHKTGIPPSARWTKISRVLVNPEALERANERFEEREEYVIVLRVLSREEIQKLADRTKSIRETREREWQRKLEERQHRKTDQGDSEYSDRDVDDQRPQLLLEQGPAPTPTGFHNFAPAPGPQQQQQQQQRQQSSMPLGTMPGAPVIPDINIDQNYSQNYSQNV